MESFRLQHAHRQIPSNYFQGLPQPHVNSSSGLVLLIISFLLGCGSGVHAHICMVWSLPGHSHAVYMQLHSHKQLPGAHAARLHAGNIASLEYCFDPFQALSWLPLSSGELWVVLISITQLAALPVLATMHALRVRALV